MASSHLTRTLDATSGGGYSNKWTWSGWVKRSNLGELGIMGNQRTDNNINSRFKFSIQFTMRHVIYCLTMISPPVTPKHWAVVLRKPGCGWSMARAMSA